MNFQIPGSARRERQQATASPSPEELRLRVEIRTLRDKVAAQENRLEVLQRANEALYRQDYGRTGGPRFDTAQPFGRLEARPAGEVPLTAGGSA